jgi:ABC-type multidrug transport system fused ATPase/permease subunit
MRNIKYFIDVVEKLSDILTKKQKVQSGSAFVWMFIASIFELMGISIIVPLITAFLDIEGIMKNKYIKSLAVFLGIDTYFGLLALMVIVVIIIYLLKNIIILYSRHVQARYQCTIEKELSLTMMESYLKRPYSYFVNANSTEIMRGVVEDVDRIFLIIQTFFTLLAESITVCLIVAFLIYSDWVMALGIFLTAILLFLIIVFGFKNILKREGVHFRNSGQERNKNILQISQGIKDIFVMQRKEYFKGKLEESCEEYKKAKNIYTTVQYCPERIIETVFISCILGAICVRIGQGVDTAVLLPQIGALAVAGYRMLPSINKLTSGINQIIFYIPSLNEAHENIINARRYLETADDSNVKGSNGFSFENELKASNVQWRYSDSSKIILDNVSLNIKKGDSVALIGESGAGKTTLGDIILGLYKPLQGKVLCDGNDVYNNLKQWANIISYVPQSVYLLDDTVRANVVFGHDNDDESKIWKALEQAQLKDFIEGLPEGLETVVGEGGVKFSGGQRQRIAIARALYCEPEILLLDEATSALDNETEEAVMEAIDSLKGKKTLIIIAHRLSTIKNCNHVYEVKNTKLYDVTDRYK